MPSTASELAKIPAAVSFRFCAMATICPTASARCAGVSSAVSPKWREGIFPPVLDASSASGTGSNSASGSCTRASSSASEELARVQEPDAELLPVPDAEEASSTGGKIPSRHFGETAELTPAQRADAVGQIVAIAQKRKLTAAGIFASSEAVEGIFNSRGLSAWHTQTSAEISITMLAPDSSGWQKANFPDAARLDPAHLAQIAAEKAIASAAPREVAAGKYTVILEPAAVLDTGGFAFYDFGGLAILA